MKAAVVPKRAEARDYIDLDALIGRAGIDLPAALSAARHVYGPSFNPQITLKALCYFDDGNLSTIPGEVRERLATAVKAVDLDRLPRLDRLDRSSSPEQVLSDPVRFLAYAMTYASHEDMRAIREHVTDDDLREALDKAPPGIIDPRSWSYWYLKVGRYPAPPPPRRQL